jgi:hypothetical protein
MGYGVICQACGVEAPSKQVEFYQNVGALVMRFHRSVKGKLCKRCIHANFWKMSGITLAVGWLGTISIIVAPFFLINNIARYLGALGMPPVPPGAKPPQVTNDVIARVYPKMGDIADRLNRGEDLADIAREVAPLVGVTPGELLMYVVSFYRSQQSQPAPVAQPTGGFPVIQRPPPLPPGHQQGPANA